MYIPAYFCLFLSCIVAVGLSVKIQLIESGKAAGHSTLMSFLPCASTPGTLLAVHWYIGLWKLYSQQEETSHRSWVLAKTTKLLSFARFSYNCSCDNSGFLSYVWIWFWLHIYKFLECAGSIDTMVWTSTLTTSLNRQTRSTWIKNPFKTCCSCMQDVMKWVWHRDFTTCGITLAWWYIWHVVFSNKGVLSPKVSGTVRGRYLGSCHGIS